ncbi:MAG: hypothetical protein ACJ8KU_05955 [Chthoniobacterales bacterium]
MKPMLVFVLILLVVALPCAALGKQSHSHGKAEHPAMLMAGLGKVHHALSTQNAQAQAFFDQGLALVYGFNHDEARRSFQRAAELDPKLAMAWWGIALTLGPNYNLPVDPGREKAGFAAAQHAIALKENASEPERAYIAAVAERYSDRPDADLHALDFAYKSAMQKVAERYPDDLDAATLYAESAMDLRPWHLWSADGKPAEGTTEIVGVLQSVLKRDPNHLGANHYLIHATEASPHPEQALGAAERLAKLAPASGHLVHMPAHIYARLGDHEASAQVNDAAAAADRKYLAATGEKGVYPMMYYSHNLHFLAYAGCMDGDFESAKKAAAQLVANVAPAVKTMPMLEGFMPTPLAVFLAFEKWNELLKMPQPDSSFAMTTAFWRFARGIAFAKLGKTAEARNEQNAWRESVEKIPREGMFDQLNKNEAVLKIPEHLLASAVAENARDTAAALDQLRQAVGAEDALAYSEPPSWYPPVRPQLGRMLLAQKRAAEAENVFRTDLDKNPRHGRSLAGLRDALDAEGRHYDAEQIDQQYRAAWKVVSARHP